MHHTPDLGFRRGQTASAFAGVSLTGGTISTNHMWQLIRKARPLTFKLQLS